MIKSVVWASMIDYPDNICTTLFVGQCNWRCVYCHNQAIYNLPSIDFQKEILPKLLKRQSFINHIIISGGECLSWSKTISVINTLTRHNFIVGIHTNGSYPKRLQEIIDKIDFVGMDIKTIPDKYPNLIKTKIIYNELLESIKIILGSKTNYEFRTTLFPNYVTLNDCYLISKMLKQLGAKEYMLQQFDDANVQTKVQPYDINFIENILNICNENIITKIKGI